MTPAALERPIVVLSEQYYPKIGGAVRYVDGLVGGLAASGYRVKLVVPSVAGEMGEPPAGSTESRFGTDRLEVIRISAKGDVHGAWRRRDRRRFVADARTVLDERLPEWGPLAVHVAYGHYLAAAVRNVTNVPTFWTVHNIPPAESQNWWRQASGVSDLVRNLWAVVHGVGSGFVHRLRISLSPYSCVIAVSDHVAGKLRSVPRSGHLEVVGEGFTAMCCDVGEELSRHREATHRHGKLSLLTVAGVAPHKGQHIGVQAARFLAQGERRFAWQFVGPTRHGRYMRQLRAAISAHGLEGRVDLIGPVDGEELCRLYRNSDLYVQLSLEEGFCLAVLEALAHGVPVVGTPTGAIRQLVEQGTGQVVDKAEPEAIAEAIDHQSKFTLDGQNRREIASRMRRRFNWQVVAERMISLYREHQ